MITEDYVNFEIAKLLRKKGFDENTPVNYFVGDDKPRGCVVGEMIHHKRAKEDTHLIACPTLQMAMKWLREVYNIGIFPTTFYRHTKTFDGHNYGCTLVNLKTFDLIGNFEDCTFPADSYEETVEKAIKYCLENLV